MAYSGVCAVRLVSGGIVGISPDWLNSIYNKYMFGVDLSMGMWGMDQNNAISGTLFISLPSSL